MVHSIELYASSSDLHWPEFLDCVQKKKNATETKLTNGSLLLLNVFARKIYRRPAMGLNRHTSSDGSGGNFSAELSYYKRSSISSGETRNPDFCSEIFGFGRKSEIPVSPEEMLDLMW